MEVEGALKRQFVIFRACWILRKLHLLGEKAVRSSYLIVWLRPMLALLRNCMFARRVSLVLRPDFESTFIVVCLLTNKIHVWRARHPFWDVCCLFRAALLPLLYQYSCSAFSRYWVHLRSPIVHLRSPITGNRDGSCLLGTAGFLSTVLQYHSTFQLGVRKTYLFGWHLEYYVEYFVAQSIF